MDTSLPDGRRGQILAVALTLTLLASLWFGVASPLAGWYQQREAELAQRRLLLQHMRAVAELLPALQHRPTTHPAISLLAGATDAIAAAAMQSAVQAMAASAKVDLASMETLPAQAHGAYRQIGLRVSLSASWPALIALLRGAQTGQPRMVIDELDVRPVPMQQRSADTPVNASFTLLAFRHAARGNE